MYSLNNGNVKNNNSIVNLGCYVGRLRRASFSPTLAILKH